MLQGFSGTFQGVPRDLKGVSRGPSVIQRSSSVASGVILVHFRVPEGLGLLWRFVKE